MVNKKKSIEELEKEVAELIAESGWCEHDIFTDFNDYRALNKRYNVPVIFFNNGDISRKTDLHLAFLLYQSITNKRKKIQMEICLPSNITIVEKRTRSIISLIQSTVIIEIGKNIMFTPTRFCNEFSYFFLQLLS